VQIYFSRVNFADVNHFKRRAEEHHSRVKVLALKEMSDNGTFIWNIFFSAKCFATLMFELVMSVNEFAISCVCHFNLFHVISPHFV
jgi:hypothetical protein